MTSLIVGEGAYTAVNQNSEVVKSLVVFELVPSAALKKIKKFMHGALFLATGPSTSRYF